MSTEAEEREHADKLYAQQLADEQRLRPFNAHITYHFKDHAHEPVSVNSVHIPNVGERVAFSSLELRHKDALPGRDYGSRDRYWRVYERIFIMTVPTTPKSIILHPTQQRVEIYVEPIH